MMRATSELMEDLEVLAGHLEAAGTIGFAMSVRDARTKLAKVQELFAGGPDTSCRTTWHDGVEYIEVPMADLQAALEEPL